MGDKRKKVDMLTSTPIFKGKDIEVPNNFQEKISQIGDMLDSVEISEKKPQKITAKLIVEAIGAVGVPRKGASLSAIQKYVTANTDASKVNVWTKKAILKALEAGDIIRSTKTPNAIGVTGSFMKAKIQTKKPAMEDSKGKKSKKPSEKDTQKDKKPTVKTTSKSTSNPPEGKPKQDKATNEKKTNKAKNTETENKTTNKQVKTKTDSKLTDKTAKNKLKVKNEKIAEEAKNQNVKKTKPQKPTSAKNKPSKTVANEPADEVSDVELDSEVKVSKQTKKRDKATSKQILDSQDEDLLPEEQPVVPVKKAKLVKGKKNLASDEIARKDLSDTELDKSKRRVLPLKSYSSDTEFEISRKIESKSKKAPKSQSNEEPKVSKKKNRKVEISDAVFDDVTEGDDESLTLKNQSKMKKGR